MTDGAEEAEDMEDRMHKFEVLEPIKYRTDNKRGPFANKPPNCRGRYTIH